jgi:hypothetical protein
MKRDLKINYGTLDAMGESLTTYLTNLNEMKEAAENINTLIASSEGKAVKALKKSYQKTLDAIDAYYERISDLKTLLYDYTTDMTQEIQPKVRSEMTRADSNDTYWAINNYDVSINPLDVGEWSFLGQVGSEDVCGVDESWKVVKLSSQIQTMNRVASAKKDLLWEIHEKVARYEKIDNDYFGRAFELYAKYTGYGTRVREEYADTFKSVGRGFWGIGAGLVELVKSVLTLAALVPSAQVYALTKPLGKSPKWLDEFVEGSWAGIAGFIRDPGAALAAMVKQFADAFDEDPAYAIGTLIPDIALCFVPFGVGAKGVSGVARGTAVATRGVRAAETVVNAERVIKHLDDVPIVKPGAGGGLGHTVNVAKPTGTWVRVNEGMSDSSRAYQAYVTGRTNQVWIENGVRFDGMINGKLIEVKGDYSRFYIDGKIVTWFTGDEAIAIQAWRQLEAANGVPVEWHVLNEPSLKLFEAIFARKGITDIKLILHPMQ